MVYGSGLLAVWLMASAGLTQTQPPAQTAASNQPDAGYYFLLGRYLSSRFRNCDRETSQN